MQKWLIGKNQRKSKLGMPFLIPMHFLVREIPQRPNFYHNRFGVFHQQIHHLGMWDMPGKEKGIRCQTARF